MTTQTSVSLNSAPDVAALIEKDRIRGSVYTNEALFEQEMKKSSTAAGCLWATTPKSRALVNTCAARWASKKC